MHQKSVKQNMDFYNFPELFPENSEILYIDTHNYLLFTKDKNPVIYWIQTQNNNKMHELLDKVSGDHKNITINIPLNNKYSSKNLKTFLNYGFNNPEIKFKIKNYATVDPYVELKYLPNSKKMSVAKLQKHIENFTHAPKSICYGNAQLTKKCVTSLKKLIKLKNEKSGILELKPVNAEDSGLIYEINVKSTNIGNGTEADIVNSKYNFHSHPQEAYIIFNCDLGWPSMDDFSTFLSSFIYFHTCLHIVSTVEGLYILSLNPETMKMLLKNPERMEKMQTHIEKYYGISKINYNKDDGIVIRNHKIHSPEDFITYCNNTQFKDTKSPLFTIKFLDWKTARNVIPFIFPKVNGICKA
jgi:hypothetical protein